MGPGQEVAMAIRPQGDVGAEQSHALVIAELDASSPSAPLSGYYELLLFIMG